MNEYKVVYSFPYIDGVDETQSYTTYDYTEQKAINSVARKLASDDDFKENCFEFILACLTATEVDRFI